LSIACFAGKRPRPLEPSCSIWLIRSDLTTVLCEITSSVRVRRLNDEDLNLGIVDPNPETDEVEGEETEILFCLRPLSEGKETGDDLRLGRKSQDANDGKESEETTTDSAFSENGEVTATGV
jgi:hypothetical protein